MYLCLYLFFLCYSTLLYMKGQLQRPTCLLFQRRERDVFAVKHTALQPPHQHVPLVCSRGFRHKRCFAIGYLFGSAASGNGDFMGKHRVHYMRKGDILVVLLKRPKYGILARQSVATHHNTFGWYDGPGYRHGDHVVLVSIAYHAPIDTNEGSPGFNLVDRFRTDVPRMQQCLGRQTQRKGSVPRQTTIDNTPQFRQEHFALCPICCFLLN